MNPIFPTTFLKDENEKSSVFKINNRYLSKNKNLFKNNINFLKSRFDGGLISKINKEKNMNNEYIHKIKVKIINKQPDNKWQKNIHIIII